jgi:hypothetical protein
MRFALAVPLVALAVAAAGAALAAEPVKLYPFEKATLTYRVSGAQEGTQTIYIKDHGRITAQHIAATVPAERGPQRIDVWTFTDPQWVYTYDAVAGEGFRTPNPQATSGIEAATSQELFEKVTASFGGRRIGADTFNGTPCTVWSMGPQSDTRICVDERLVMQYMRSDGDMMQGNVELTSAEIGTVDDARFQRPQAQYRDMPPMPGPTPPR